MTYYDLLQNPLQLLIVEVLPPEQAAAAGLSTGEARVQTILLLETVSQSVTLGWRFTKKTGEFGTWDWESRSHYPDWKCLVQAVFPRDFVPAGNLGGGRQGGQCSSWGGACFSAAEWCQHVSTCFNPSNQKNKIYQNLTDPVSCGCKWLCGVMIYIDFWFNQFLYLSLSYIIQELRKLILGRVHNRQNKWQVMGCFEWYFGDSYSAYLSYLYLQDQHVMHLQWQCRRARSSSSRVHISEERRSNTTRSQHFFCKTTPVETLSENWARKDRKGMLKGLNKLKRTLWVVLRTQSFWRTSRFAQSSVHGQSALPTFSI